MQFSLTAIVLGLAAVACALPADTALVGRQNANRPVPSGTCCVANTSLKQDACKAANGQAGRCVPGGNNCGSRLSCIAQSSLTCDNNRVERGKSLCRANFPGGGLFDGAKVVQNLNQVTI
ncbi:hypothetical protein C8A00DRAFT_17037 [Chaetomidium leptoderma]|uniref:Uncharacterized protein n=1 Tax=Chaetomidium leptoderma TaxID=669021 RepID=A0AAN6VHE2_9PEZI|nr:hypothetical protein C8A00DRAFT_17037 [Chaetomidium leptoderma]